MCRVYFGQKCHRPKNFRLTKGSARKYWDDSTECNNSRLKRRACACRISLAHLGKKKRMYWHRRKMSRETERRTWWNKARTDMEFIGIWACWNGSRRGKKKGKEMSQYVWEASKSVGRPQRLYSWWVPWVHSAAIHIWPLVGQTSHKFVYACGLQWGQWVVGGDGDIDGLPSNSQWST